MASEQPTYIVLARVSDDEAKSWREFGPFPASHGDAAIDALRDDVPTLKRDTGAQFVAVAESRFRRRRMRRQLVQRFMLDDADVPDDPVPGEDPEQGKLT